MDGCNLTGRLRDTFGRMCHTRSTDEYWEIVPHNNCVVIIITHTWLFTLAFNSDDNIKYYTLMATYRGDPGQVCHTLDLIDPFIAWHVQVDLVGIVALSSQVLRQDWLGLQLGYSGSYLGFKVTRRTMLFALRYSWYLEESSYGDMCDMYTI